jgi:uncharacterized protein (TIGR00369 family)
MTETQQSGKVDNSAEGWGAAHSKTVVWRDPANTAAAGSQLAGIDFLGAIRDGKLPPPPIAVLLGMDMVAIEPGRVVFECAMDESVYNPIGMVHGGLACTLADTVIGCAVHTTLEAGVAYTSIDLNVSYLRPITLASSPIRATGVVTKPGRRVAFARAEIVDSEGKLVATAVGSCLIMAGNAAPLS